MGGGGKPRKTTFSPPPKPNRLAKIGGREVVAESLSGRGFGSVKTSATKARRGHSRATLRGRPGAVNLGRSPTAQSVTKRSVPVSKGGCRFGAAGGCIPLHRSNKTGFLQANGRSFGGRHQMGTQPIQGTEAIADLQHSLLVNSHFLCEHDLLKWIHTIDAPRCHRYSVFSARRSCKLVNTPHRW